MCGAPIACATSQDELVEALLLAKEMRNISNDFCDERGGLTRGHTDKVLGPSRAKALTQMTLDLFLEMFAVQIVLIPNPVAEARMRERWEGRDVSNVRIERNRVSKSLLDRARPFIMKEVMETLTAAAAAADKTRKAQEKARAAAAAAAKAAAKAAAAVEAPTPRLVHEQPEAPPRESTGHAHLRVIEQRVKGGSLWGGAL